MKSTRPTTLYAENNFDFSDFEDGPENDSILNDDDITPIPHALRDPAAEDGRTDLDRRIRRRLDLTAEPDQSGRGLGNVTPDRSRSPQTPPRSITSSNSAFSRYRATNLFDGITARNAPSNTPSNSPSNSPETSQTSLLGKRKS